MDTVSQLTHARMATTYKKDEFIEHLRVVRYVSDVWSPSKDCIGIIFTSRHGRVYGLSIRVGNWNGEAIKQLKKYIWQANNSNINNL